MSRVAVIDYGMGNLHSVAKALEYVGGDTQVLVSSDPDAILRADRVVFPGVGAIRDCMSELQRLELDEVVHHAAETKPLLAVCVGMQALLTRSAENGGVNCLDIISGTVEEFSHHMTDERSGQPLKVPHMGWNQVTPTHPHALWENIPRDTRFYFVHSFFTRPVESSDIAATADYGSPFTAAIARGNVFAVQFHPEKSAQAGLNLYANFLRWDGQD